MSEDYRALLQSNLKLVTRILVAGTIIIGLVLGFAVKLSHEMYWTGYASGYQQGVIEAQEYPHEP